MEYIHPIAREWGMSQEPYGLALNELQQAGETGHDTAARVEGAWYGRIAGNMLGKPVEGIWRRKQLTAYLEGCDALPLDDYILLEDESRGRELGFWVWKGLTRGRVNGGSATTTSTTPCSDCTCSSGTAPPSPRSTSRPSG